MSAPIFIDPAKCKACQKCVKQCPFGALHMTEKDGKKLAEVDAVACRACSACVKACPFAAISEVKAAKKRGTPDMESYHDIWVFAEQVGGVVQGVAYELVAKGRELADARGCKLAAILLGYKLSDAAKQSLIARGADKVIVVDQPELAAYEPNVYAEAVSALIKKMKPEAVLAGATTIGRAFLPKVAVRVQAGLTADCTALAIAPSADGATKILHQTRPAFGGNIMATIFTPDHRPQMATVRPKVFKEGPADPKRAGEILAEALTLAAAATRVVKTVPAKDIVDIAAADILVVGGRGLKKAENFALLEKLAKKIGGVVASSRAAVDAGWISQTRQVGQTGKTVSPRLYISFGVSGAIQHLAGMRGSDTIIAVNSDPNAPIFGVADLGIVGDLFEILPALLKALDERKA